MDLLKWTISGLIAGAVGAAVWAAIAYYGNVEIGWIAWLIGAFVGMAVRIASESGGGAAAGTVAAIIAAGSVAGGKYAAVTWAVSKEVSKVTSRIEIDDEMVLVSLADTLADQWETDGKEIKWPDGVNPEEAGTEAEYPKDLWKEATRWWESMTPDQQNDYRETMRDELEAGITGMAREVTGSAFKASFGVFDILWFFLAVGTAFKVGLGDD